MPSIRVPLLLLLVLGMLLSACGGSSVFSLEVGDCLNEPDPSDEEISSVETVECSEAHDAEVYFVGDVPDAESYPADITTQADELCGGDNFTQFIGVPWLESEFSYVPIYPSESSWGDGDREVVCYVFRDDGQQMTGTARGAGAAAAAPAPSEAAAVPAAPAAGEAPPAEPAPADAPPAAPAGPLAVGTCFQDSTETLEGNRAAVAPVDCAEAHDNEVYAVFDLPEGPFPGVDQIAQLADEGCGGTRFEEFVGVAWLDSQFSHLELVPTEATWAAGDRQVACYLYRDDIQRMTGSMQGVGADAPPPAS